MSGIQGKKGRNFDKLLVAESSVPSVGFKNVRALHEASAGQTIIDLSSLTDPAAALANGYTQPAASDLQKVSLRAYKDNVTVRTGTGQLIQDIDYVITGAKTIRLSVPALEAQVFEITINAEGRSGTTLVDAQPLIASDILAADTTDFNTGEPFAVGDNITKQIGSVMVFVDGQLFYRNVGNQPDGEGDYYEVHAGGGLGTIIRFNASDSVDRDVVVVSVGSLVERPDGSQMAYLDTLAGQIDVLREILEEVTDETIAPGAPNQVDLKAFGDRVLALEAILDTEVPIMTDWVNDGALTVDAITTAPVKGATSVDNVWWRRVGENMEIRIEYYQTSNAGSSAGSGDYLFKIPTTNKIDTTKVVPYTTPEGTGSFDNRNIVGSCMSSNAGTTPASGNVSVYDEDFVRFFINNASTWAIVSSAFADLADVGTIGYQATFSVPIVGWEATQTIREQLGL